MTRRYELTMPLRWPLLCPLLAVLLLAGGARAVCPHICSCQEGHREVDCARRALRHLPADLQHNVRSLNLSGNCLLDLDGGLSPYTHLRTLDVSHNRLVRLPAALPRALWEIGAAGNRIRVLEKNDTAYHWNLRRLDLSANLLERVVFINNTLPSLRALNLSHNRFWTVPTNMPHNLEEVDLSHNSLVQILPGSLDRLRRLERLYLHANRFFSVGQGAFRHLAGLKLLTLGDNPWACDERANVADLLAWVRHTSARVLGCPCHTWYECGDANQARTWGWHFASYTLSPWGTGQRELSRPPAEAVTTGYRSPATGPDAEPAGDVSRHPHHVEEKGPFRSELPSNSTPHVHSSTDGPFTSEGPFVDGIVSTVSTTTSATGTTGTRRATTPRTRSVKRANQGMGRNTSPGQVPLCPYVIVFNSFLLSAFVL